MKRWLWIGAIALCCWLGFGLAAPARAATPGEAVAGFLTELPSDYHAVFQIDALKAAVKQEQALLIDVREPREYRAGHIPGARNIPLRALPAQRDQLPRDRPLILYCSTGYRTALGVTALHLWGYENARGFPPSFRGWQSAGEAVE